MARMNVYNVIGRYMDGTEVVAYQLMNVANGEQKRYSREQMYYLAGRGQLSNCGARLYQDKVLLEGVGMSLNDLPIVDVSTGKLKNTDGIGHVRRGTSNEQAMSQLICIGRTSNNDFVLKNVAGAVSVFDSKQTFKLARDGKIGNMRAQIYNNPNTKKEQPILRMTDGSPLSSLSIIE